MTRKIIGNCTDHNLKDAKFLKSDNFVCTLCAMGKLILWLSPLKIHAGPLRFLERIKEVFMTPFNHYVVPLDTSWF
jgi:hypothetical protein